MITHKDKKGKNRGGGIVSHDAYKHGYMLLACIHEHTLSIHANTNSNPQIVYSACHGFISMYIYNNRVVYATAACMHYLVFRFVQNS